MLIKTALQAVALTLALLLAPAAAQATPPASAPPGYGMSAAADPRAVAAATAMLAKGGSATDAAIAAMMVLGLVEPQSAGVGGGGFLMHFDAGSKRVQAYDGRETAPAGATPEMFLGADAKPLPRLAAMTSGRATGVPGLVPMLRMAHADHGRLPWRDLFGPAITLAEQGFVVSPRLAQWIAFVAERGGPASPEGRAYLLDSEGKPLKAGVVLRNPDYAETLRQIARRGPDAILRGPIAQAIVARAQAEPLAGTLSLQDLRGYKPRKLTPLCAPHRAYRVCTMPPPGSGSAVLEILGLFQRARPQPEGPQSTEDWAAFLWASRLAYADRDHYVADDAFVPVPSYGLIAGEYLDHRAKSIALPRAAPDLVEPGDPAAILGGESLLDRWGREPQIVKTGTTHLTVVDAAGDAVALTATVESIFGTQRMAGGFFLNNQLTDFSFEPTKNGKPVANAVAPNKRPRSSMSPAIVVDDRGNFVLATGSPGGSAIVGYVAKSLIGMLDWGLDPQAAIDLPNLIAQRAPASAEMARIAPGIADALAARGWVLRPVTQENSGIHAIKRTPDGGLQGGADPRREGVAVGSPPPSRTRN